MEVKVNREIREYTEGVFFGMSLRQCVFALLACVAAVGLFVQQADGRRFRAELPVSVDAQSTVLKAEIRDLFGPEAMIA